MTNSAERAALIQLIELPPDTANEDVPVQVLAWMAGVVSCSVPDPDVIERAVLEWVAKKFSIDVPESMDTNDIERVIRREIAAEATELLMPIWRVACAIGVHQKTAVDREKFDLLVAAAHLVVPSRSVLSERRDEFRKLAARWQGADPRADLKADLEQLNGQTNLARQAMRLGLILALADGRLTMEEEHLAYDLGDSMGLTKPEVADIAKELNQLFWRQRDGLKEGEGSSEEVAMTAAQLALQESGALEGLAVETRNTLLAKDSPEEPAKVSKGWSRLVGALSGLNEFFSNKIDDKAQAKVARIVYLSILKQWEGVFAQHERQPVYTESFLKPKPSPSGAETAQVTQEAAAEPQTVRRRIQLDPV